MRSNLDDTNCSDSWETSAEVEDGRSWWKRSKLYTYNIISYEVDRYHSILIYTVKEIQVIKLIYINSSINLYLVLQVVSKRNPKKTNYTVKGPMLNKYMEVAPAFQVV